MNKNCTGCKIDKKKELVMVTMSEAAWDRNEERHQKEKRTLLIALAIVAALLVITNACYAIHEIKNTAARDKQTAVSLSL